MKMTEHPLDESDEDLRHYTPQQVAELFQVTPETVHNWIKGGKLPALNLNGRYRIAKPDLVAFAKERHGVVSG
jgi:excisionase family DNA binding protein